MRHVKIENTCGILNFLTIKTHKGGSMLKNIIIVEITAITYSEIFCPKISLLFLFFFEKGTLCVIYIIRTNFLPFLSGFGLLNRFVPRRVFKDPFSFSFLQTVNGEDAGF